MSSLILRALDPETEQDLFRQAFEWRASPKKHTRANRMSFEDFSGNHLNQVVIGLFNGKLCAVYMFIEVQPKQFEAHFTSRKDADVSEVFAGGKTMLNWFHSQGAIVTAKVVEKNKPLRAFVEALGFRNVGTEQISCTGRTKGVQYRIVSYVSQHEDESP